VRYAVFLFACLALLTAGGCVETKNAPFVPGDLVFEPGLLGDWVEDASDGPPFPGADPAKPVEMTVRRLEVAKGGAYRHVTDIDGKKQADDLHVFKLGERYFFAVKDKDEGGYAVLRMTVSGSCVKLWEMSSRQVLGDQPGVAKHSTDFALTGPTAEVRNFLMRHSDEPGVWAGLPRVYRRKDGLKVMPAGLTGGKQRTLDYWSELRSTLQGVGLAVAGTGADAAAAWARADKAIKSMSAEGVDPDASACGPLASGLCDALTEYTRKRRRPTDQLAALVRESTGGSASDPTALPPGKEAVQDRARDVLAKLEAARKKLTERYKCDFLVIR